MYPGPSQKAIARPWKIGLLPQKERHHLPTHPFLRQRTCCYHVLCDKIFVVKFFPPLDVPFFWGGSKFRISGSYNPNISPFKKKRSVITTIDPNPTLQGKLNISHQTGKGATSTQKGSPWIRGTQLRITQNGTSVSHTAGVLQDTQMVKISTLSGERELQMVFRDHLCASGQHGESRGMDAG